MLQIRVRWGQSWVEGRSEFGRERLMEERDRPAAALKIERWIDR